MPLNECEDSQLMDVANLVSLIIMLGLAWVAAFMGLSVIIWTGLIGAALIVCTIFGFLTSIPLLIILWLLFLGAALFANLHEFRKRYFTTRLLKMLKAKLPPISVTEREAIEAGNVWWEKDLFNGSPDWGKLFNIPQPKLSPEEESFLNNQVEQLCSMLNDWEIMNKDRDLPTEVWDFLKKEKFFALCVPKEYGGLGFSALLHSTVIIKIATRSLSAAVDTMVPNSLGPAELIFHYGTEEQKNYYLPRLADGREIPCFALTAPDAGSDAGAIPDTGIICRGEFEGREIIGMRVTWDKRYITLAPIATILGLAIHLYDPEHLLSDKVDIGITLCLLPTQHPGVEIGTRHLPLYQAFMNGPTRGKNVFIPLDWIIGGPQMAGNGWRMLMECLSIGRAISLPALSTACGKAIYRFTGAYSRIRKQFNVPIASFEGIEEALAYIAGTTYILEAARVMTAGAVDLKIKPAIASAIAKYHLTEISRCVIARAMDIHAGHMIQVGPRNLLANAHIANPISITVEGANILTRNLIIFGQGSIRCHPYLLNEIELISAEKTDIKALDKVLMSHIGYFIRNLLKSFAYGLSGGLFIMNTNIKNAAVKKYQRQMTRMSTALALLADTSLILLGGSLKRRERISARLGDILSELYLASAVLKYFHDHQEPDSDVDYVCWALAHCLYRIQNASDELFINFPNKLIGLFLKVMIFPFGRAYAFPKDNLSKKIVAPMLMPTEIRDRLTKNCYVSKNVNELSCRLEEALKELVNVEPLTKKLHLAVKEGKIEEFLNHAEKLNKAEELKILSAEEANELRKFEQLKQEIIQVNEFSFDLSQVIN